MANIKVAPNSTPLSIEATEIYYGDFPSTSPVKLRVSVGGAGQSGLLRALANAFIRHNATKGSEPFAIACFATDTTASFNTLAQNVVDMSVTYHPAAERTAIAQGIADRREYAFRDHWMIVGPRSNPAGLEPNTTSSVHDLFVQIFRAAIDTSTSKDPVRFLSRYDKSAANIKESNLWSAIGQTPWSYPYSNWYHRYVEFPFRALEVAARLKEYTLTDRGTWFSVEQWIRDEMTVFKVGGDAEEDPLLNPAHVLIGTHAKNKARANEFTDWLISADGGQRVLQTFASNGVILYSPSPLSKIKSRL